MKVKFKTLPSVSSNRSFYVTRYDNHIWHVVFGHEKDFGGGWLIQCDHKTIEIRKTAKDAKSWLSDYIGYLSRCKALSAAL